MKLCEIEDSDFVLHDMFMDEMSGKSAFKRLDTVLKIISEIQKSLNNKTNGNTVISKFVKFFTNRGYTLEKTQTSVRIYKKENVHQNFADAVMRISRYNDHYEIGVDRKDYPHRLYEIKIDAATGQIRSVDDYNILKESSEEDLFAKQLSGQIYTNPEYVKEYLDGMYEHIRPAILQKIKEFPNTDPEKLLNEYIVEEIDRFAKENGFNLSDIKDNKRYYLKINKDESREIIHFGNLLFLMSYPIPKNNIMAKSRKELDTERLRYIIEFRGFDYNFTKGGI